MNILREPVRCGPRHHGGQASQEMLPIAEEERGGGGPRWVGEMGSRRRSDQDHEAYQAQEDLKYWPCIPSNTEILNEEVNVGNGGNPRSELQDRRLERRFL